MLQKLLYNGTHVDTITTGQVYLAWDFSIRITIIIPYIKNITIITQSNVRSATEGVNTFISLYCDVIPSLTQLNWYTTQSESWL